MAFRMPTSPPRAPSRWHAAERPSKRRMGASTARACGTRASAAGQGAAARSCELLVAEGFDVNVAILDAGEDPDTCIRRKGPDAYREKLRTSRPYLEYLLDRAAAEVDFRQDDSRRQFEGLADHHRWPSA